MPTDREKSILFVALDRQGEERRRYLDEVCGGDATLRARIESLIAAHSAAGEFMSADGPHGDPEVGPGTTIGRYRLIERIGDGGFGSVYLAEQSEPVSRRVAVKVLNPWMSSPQVIARFDAERQALAMMDHPGIAKILDAGSTPTGRPYFVMEYCDGQPITAFCDHHRLTIRERVELHESVCQAVQHAHQKGVIHRDLKPSNVLVSLVDGRPRPVVIDFGIAKALGSKLTERTLHTEAHQVVGTPSYMAPEQVASGSEDIDTRTDVYALGLLLYELLAGAPPFDPERLRTATLPELARIIRDEEPPRPSARVRGLGDELPRVARCRRVDPARLARELQGDLDWIVMRALEKQRDRRYPTANALATDLHRHLTDQPVDAGPPSTLYRAGKFAKRYSIELGAAAAVAAALVVTTMVSLRFAARESDARILADHQAAEARTELAKYESIARFTQSILAGVDPAFARGADRTLLRRILDDAAARVETELSDRPEVEVAIRNTIGYTYFTLGEYDLAEAQFDRAVRVARESLPDDDQLRLDAEENLAGVYFETGRYDLAEELTRRLIVAHVRVHGENHAKSLDAMADLATLFDHQGRPEEARDQFRRVLHAQIAAFGDDSEETLTTRNNLAGVLKDLKALDEAEQMYRLVLDRQRALRGDDHPQTLTTMNNLAVLYQDMGRLDDADRILREALEIKRRIHAPDHPSVIISINNLASLASDRGDEAEAERLMLEALALAEQSLGGDDIRTLGVINNLANLYRKQRRWAEAEPLLVRCRTGFGAILGAGHMHALTATDRLAQAHLNLNRPDEARRVAQEGLIAAAEALGQDHWIGALFSLRLAQAALANGQDVDDVDSLLSIHARLVERFGENHEIPREAAGVVANLYERLGRTDDALAWRDKSVDPGDQ